MFVFETSVVFCQKCSTSWLYAMKDVSNMNNNSNMHVGQSVLVNCDTSLKFFSARDEQMNIVCPTVICTSDMHIVENISNTDHQRKCNATYLHNRISEVKMALLAPHHYLKMDKCCLVGFYSYSFTTFL
jgi:hypothetical protein